MMKATDYPNLNPAFAQGIIDADLPPMSVPCSECADDTPAFAIYIDSWGIHVPLCKPCHLAALDSTP